jgi:cell division protein FtsI (penicillin-binding protein 3)
MSLPGVHFLKEYQRFYPMGNLAAHVIGFSGIDSQGLEGIEYSFNIHLMDNSGLSGFWSYLYKNPDPITFSGGSLHLTIQSKLQYYAEKELRKAVYASGANNGVAIIMESQTGDILAMVNIPDYDPNNFDRYDSSRYFNRAVNATYEPGSTFKVITVATALENKVIEKDSIFFCEEGEYQIQDRVIHDVAKYGWLPLEKIIQKSSNICAAKIGQRIPKSIFYKYIRDFGFGTITGIDLPGEVSGKVYNYQSWSDTDVATMSFGHSIAATPIQVITAINAVATGGYLIQPKIIQSAFKADGTRIFQKQTKGRQVIKKETADLLKSFMESVVHPGGTGYLARLEGTSVAGKTGTSRKFDQRKQEYSKTNNISSFIGFFPAEEPLLTILVIIDEPQHQYLGTKSAAPVFKKIAEHALRLYPDTLQRNRSDNDEPAPTTTFFEANRQSIPLARDMKSIPLAFRGLTLREALTLANEMDLQIAVKGAGRVREVQLLNEKEKSYALILK